MKKELQPVITAAQALEYEGGRTSFFMSLVYRMFPRLFVSKYKRSYTRYVEFRSGVNGWEPGVDRLESISKIKTDI